MKLRRKIKFCESIRLSYDLYNRYKSIFQLFETGKIELTDLNGFDDRKHFNDFRKSWITNDNGVDIKAIYKDGDLMLIISKYHCDNIYGDRISIDWTASFKFIHKKEITKFINSISVDIENNFGIKLHKEYERIKEQKVKEELKELEEILIGQ